MARIFYGIHDRKLDYKGRLGIPDDLLTASGGEWQKAIIIKDVSRLRSSGGHEPHFASLFDRESWEELLTHAQARMDADESRLFMNAVVGDAATLDVDASKRITVPDRFLQHAGIERQAGVKIVGNFNHIELWNPDTYARHVEALEIEDIQVTSIEDLVSDLARNRIHAVS